MLMDDGQEAIIRMSHASLFDDRGDSTQDWVGTPLPTSLINYEPVTGLAAEEGELKAVVLIPAIADRVH